MKIHVTELANVCQHARLVHEWSPRTNLIIGPIGSGKSNLLKAIKFNLLGDFDNYGVKEDNVWQFAAARSKSYVRQELTHEGNEIEITRYLAGGKSEIVVNGTRSIGERAITDVLTDLVKANRAILDNYVFVGQHTMFDFIDQTPGKRAEGFNKVFDLETIAVVHKAIGEAIRKAPAPADPAIEIDQIRLRLRTAQTEIKAAKADLATVAHVVGVDPSDTPHAATLANATTHATFIEEIAELDDQIGDYNRTIKALRTQHTAASQDLADLRTAIEESKADVDGARTALAAWTAHRKSFSRHTKARTTHAALVAELAARPRPDQPPGYEPAATLDAARIKLADQIAADEDFLATFAADGVAACPTCGTLRDSLQTRVDAVAAALPARQTAHADLRTRATVAANWERADQTWRRWYDVQRSKIEQAAQAEAEADRDIAQAPSGSAEEVEEVVTAFDALCAADRAMTKTVHDLAIDLATERASRTGLRNRREFCTGQLERLAVAPEAYEAAVAGLAGFMEDIRRHGLYQGRITELRRQKAADQARLDALQAQAVEVADARAWNDRLEDYRTITARLPSLVVKNYLEIVTPDVNTLLGQFEAPFQVTLGAELAFLAHFVDGRVQEAGRLSGGQHVQLALAFRVAVNSLFADKVGLLTLDEPTQYLDADSMGAVKAAMAYLRSLSDSRGLQCLLVTHEPQFVTLFDNVLQLAA